MPYNRRELEQRLLECDEKLDELCEQLLTSFIDPEVKKQIEDHINMVNKYYNTSYQKAKDTPKIEAIIITYEQYVEILTKIKNGTYNSPQQTLKEFKAEALVNISDNNIDRKLDVVLWNLAKGCQAVFWAAVSITLFSLIFLIALPTLIVQPVIGIATMMAVCGFLLITAMKFLNCFNEFRTLGRHNDEFKAEASLLERFSIFAPDSVSSDSVSASASNSAVVALAPDSDPDSPPVPVPASASAA